MPLYDYRCDDCALVWDEQRPIARRQSSCPACRAPADPLITFRGAFSGLSTPGHAAASWNHHGMWGQARNGESRPLADLRGMLEAGAFRAADNRTRQSALVWARTYEMARKEGLAAEARHIEGRMARLVEARTREVAGEPEQPVKGVFRTMRTTRRRSKRGIEVTREIKYT